jgi:glucosamine--fructose-6-phosphate aminotransferase (isomerizing)
MSLLYTEIHEQPAALDRLLKAESKHIQQISAAIQQRAPRFVLLAARGSSDNAARYGQYLFGAHNHLPVALATPSLFTLYQSPPDLTGALVIAISQSGQSPDILAVVEAGRRQGALTLALTNEAASPLASLAEHTIDLQAGPEKSVAATKTYTTSLLALGMLSAALSEDDARRLALERVPALIAETISQSDKIIFEAQKYRELHACVVLGRGFNYATAFEIALKMKELSYVLAEPYSSADFMHGPVALVEDGFLVIAVVPEGKTASELMQFLHTLKSRKPELVAISPLKEAQELVDVVFPLPANIPEWVSPIVAVTPGQLFALGLAQAKGFDPDHPRGLSKVTKTK